MFHCHSRFPVRSAQNYGTGSSNRRHTKSSFGAIAFNSTEMVFNIVPDGTDPDDNNPRQQQTIHKGNPTVSKDGDAVSWIIHRDNATG